jgi:hypothetical protein
VSGCAGSFTLEKYLNTFATEPSDESDPSDKAERPDEVFVPPKALDPVPPADVSPGKPEAIDKELTPPDQPQE